MMYLSILNLKSDLLSDSHIFKICCANNLQFLKQDCGKIGREKKEISRRKYEKFLPKSSSCSSKKKKRQCSPIQKKLKTLCSHIFK